jgi:hypothetical protein
MESKKEEMKKEIAKFKVEYMQKGGNMKTKGCMRRK